MRLSEALQALFDRTKFDTLSVSENQRLLDRKYELIYHIEVMEKEIKYLRQVIKDLENANSKT